MSDLRLRKIVPIEFKDWLLMNVSEGAFAFMVKNYYRMKWSDEQLVNNVWLRGSVEHVGDAIGSEVN